MAKKEQVEATKVTFEIFPSREETIMKIAKDITEEKAKEIAEAVSKIVDSE